MRRGLYIGLVYNAAGASVRVNLKHCRHIWMQEPAKAILRLCRNGSETVAVTACRTFILRADNKT